MRMDGPEATTQAVLTVDLGAIVANWRNLCARHPGGAVAAVVKADAYGLGAAAVGPALAGAGCRHFFVAHREEGVALRAAIGPGPMIAVLDDFPPHHTAAREAALVPVIGSLRERDAWCTASLRTGERRQGVILHVDTGMARLGLDAGEQAALMEADPADALGGLEILYVMTHLACADEPDHPLNALQAERFAAFCDQVLPGVPRSFANSSGIFLGPRFASDLARPGCALYGINPTPGRPNPMRQVARLEAPILQVRDIPAGATVGYGASWTAPRPSRIATVAAGYADGYLRALSGRGVRGMLAGHPVPLVGRVSMDLTTFDVTGVPEEAQPGARITLIGDAPGIRPDDLAAAAGTIGYEILTSLGACYRREYRRG
jgi:alanine racemase